MFCANVYLGVNYLANARKVQIEVGKEGCLPVDVAGSDKNFDTAPVS
jgi:hypothetical protein